MDSVTPARLVETSCKINENLSSNPIEAKAPTCLLRMTVEEPSTKEDEQPTRKDYVMELPPATLNTLLEDFKKIREQLSNIARK
ncbi:uncharacterized protein LOC107267956 [Cephus cinctus]|uniref:Uncharacterized protein LOC107267956 n=1 Tax=Cephus cinctus TaxID=211228 RepID=A0AAJ7BW10_CEPCN|nr:uncharacterized protein LOC107267956 [Cephus cinctus]